MVNHHLTSTESTVPDLRLDDPRCVEFSCSINCHARRSFQPAFVVGRAVMDLRTESGWDFERLRDGLSAFLAVSLSAANPLALHTLEIFRGRDKSGHPNNTISVLGLAMWFVSSVRPVRAKAVFWRTSNAWRKVTRRPVA